MLYVMKYAFVLLLLAGCDVQSPDQCLRNQLFERCLSLIPKGPEHTKYNDWSEVVEMCGTQAYYQSLRVRTNIKPECQL